jgi:ribosome biogenesis GTPase
VSLRERLGWNSFFERQMNHADRAGLQWARVVEEQRGLYRVAGDVEGWAEVSGRFRHAASCSADFPAVGDWVGVDGGIIHRRLDRRGTVSRAAAGRAVD